MRALRPLRILYVVYWGANEPLGRSLVVPSVRRLAALGLQVRLISFEKPEDLANAAEVGATKRRLLESGIVWKPLGYHKHPKWPATAFDVLHGVLQCLWVRREGPIDIVHARTFVGGPIGLLAAPLLRAKFVYHNEGFYPDEQVDGGVWRLGSKAHRVARALERLLYARADGIVVLSERARRQVEQLPSVQRGGKPVCVVPSAVDLDRFRLRQAPGPGARSGLKLVYIGSVGLRYLLDRVGRFVSVAGARVETSLRVFSGAPRDQIAALLTKGGLAPEAWSSEWMPHERIARELPASHAGLFFLTEGLSEHGCSPTKFGEYWACGLPVVTTPNVSDSEQIILRERVGVIVRSHTDEAYRLAVDELLQLLDDPGLPERCRRAAEAHYSLDRACRDQLALYRQLVKDGQPQSRDGDGQNG